MAWLWRVAYVTRVENGKTSNPWKHLVPSKGLEPPHRCRYMDLNHARLPIPPRWQVDFIAAAARKPPNQEDLRIYSTDAKPLSNQGEQRSSFVNSGP